VAVVVGVFRVSPCEAGVIGDEGMFALFNLGMQEVIILLVLGLLLVGGRRNSYRTDPPTRGDG
jgi:hypothetical protein